MSGTRETLEIIVKEDGTRIVRRKLEQLGDTAKKTDNSLQYMKRTLGLLGAAFSVQKMTDFLDVNTNLQNRLRATGLEGQRLKHTYQDLLDVANETRSSFEGSVELFSRLKVSSKELGATDEDLVGFTRSLNQAIILSGASAREAEAGLIQLSQGMASGRLQGDELRSVLEQLPIVADVIAKELKVTRGELRAMGADGKITSQIILKAFQSSSDELTKNFGKTVPTIGQSMTVLRNQFIDAVRAFDEATGAGAFFSGILLAMAANIHAVVSAVAALGVALAIALAPAVFQKAATAVRALYAAVSAHPLMAIATVLAAIITYIVLMRDELLLGVDDITTIGDLFRAMGELASEAFAWISQDWHFLVSFMQDNWISEWLAERLGNDAANINGFFAGVGSGFAGFAKGVARIFDTIGKYFLGLGGGIVAFFKVIPKVVTVLLKEIYNIMFNLFNGIVTLTLEGINELRALAKMDPIEIAVRKSKFEGQDKAEWLEWGSEIAAGIEDGMKMQGGLFEGALDTLFERAKRIRAEMPKETRPKPERGTPKFPGAKDKELDKFLKSLDSLLGKLDPIRKALFEFGEGQMILDKALRIGRISAEEHEFYTRRLFETYKEAIFPMQAWNDEITKQIDILALMPSKRQLEIDAMAAEQEMREKGVQVGKTESAQIRERLTQLDQMTQKTAMLDQVYSEAVATRSRLADETGALLKLLEEGEISASEAQGVVLGKLQTAGVDTTMFQAQLGQQQTLFAEYLDAIDELRANDLLSERDYHNAKVQLQWQAQAVEVQQYRNFFGEISKLQSSHLKGVAAVGRAAAMTQAVINVHEAATKAMAQGGIYGGAMAAAVIAAGMAQVAQIATAGGTLGFAVGGNFVVPGSGGGVDSQLVAFRASPGERVSVQTPAQVRKGTGALQHDQKSDSRPAAAPTNRILNVLDPGLVGEFMQTSEGEQVLINFIQKNASTVKRALDS